MIIPSLSEKKWKDITVTEKVKSAKIWSMHENNIGQNIVNMEEEKHATDVLLSIETKKNMLQLLKSRKPDTKCSKTPAFGEC